MFFGLTSYPSSAYAQLGHWAEPSGGFWSRRRKRSDLLFRRKRKPGDFNEEIEAHLRLDMERLQEQGLTKEDAAAAARRAFGNVTKTQERFYESTPWLWWQRPWQDVSFSLRMLLRNHRLSGTAVPI